MIEGTMRTLARRSHCVGALAAPAAARTRRGLPTRTRRRREEAGQVPHRVRQRQAGHGDRHGRLGVRQGPAPERRLRAHGEEHRLRVGEPEAGLHAAHPRDREEGAVLMATARPPQQRAAAASGSAPAHPAHRRPARRQDRRGAADPRAHAGHDRPVDEEHVLDPGRGPAARVHAVRARRGQVLAALPRARWTAALSDGGDRSTRSTRSRAAARSNHGDYWQVPLVRDRARQALARRPDDPVPVRHRAAASAQADAAGLGARHVRRSLRSAPVGDPRRVDHRPLRDRDRRADRWTSRPATASPSARTT